MLELTLGSAPAEEDCAQLGTPGYEERARRECGAYMRQIQRLIGDVRPEGFRLFIKQNPHDFGTYLEVAAQYDPDDVESIDLAYHCQDHIPAEWDQEARVELGLP